MKRTFLLKLGSAHSVTHSYPKKQALHTNSNLAAVVARR